MKLSPASWSRTQSPVALMVVRLLLVGNTLVLAAAGALCLVSVARPAGVVGAALIWGLAVLLLALVPYTNPRRSDRARW
ncbi:MAG TPA: hypothetical protein VN770_11620 [Gaiellaceae bacterium]|nr:hypothetical protein [Gaiellaceae bacterium]